MSILFTRRSYNSLRSNLLHIKMTAKRSMSESAEDAFHNPGTRHPSVERAEEVDHDLPFERLKLKLNTAKKNSKVNNVVHWFRTKDLRAEDNRSLAAARHLAEKGNHLLTVFVLCPAELDWHGVGSARKVFIAENIKLLSKQLRELGIPLIPLVAKSRSEIHAKVAEFVKENDVSHVYANFEYEYDELQRDIKAAASFETSGVECKLFHDQTVVEPGEVTNQKGEPRKVFTSFWNGWIPIIAKNPKKYYLDQENVPSKQESPPDDIWASVDVEDVLQIDQNDEHLKKIAALWPAGHSAAVERLEKFLKEKIDRYGKLRSNPAEDCVSRMSPYFALGVISVREALAMTREIANNNNNFGTSSSGVDAWVREIAFREFYRQMVATAIPHIVMNMPTSLKLANIETEHNEEAWQRWCNGTTGIPFVDAGMRQLNTEAYMHNRLRMNVSSYLRMNLLIDYRMGMRYFANRLVDWDCCNNSFGWDPNYTVFNPVLQAEKLDSDGEYIRKWVPELRNVEGKAIFDPANRLPPSEFEKLGYPKPMIDQQVAKQRSIERFKEAGSNSSDNKRIKQEKE